MQHETQPVKAVPPAVQFLKNQLANIQWLREGMLIDATLIQKTPRQAFFDVGSCATAIVYGAEYANAKEILRHMTIGEHMSAKVVALDGLYGYPELSLTEAGKQKLWQQVQDLLENGEVVTVKILGVNSGGLTANIGDLKAFLPFSHLSADHYPKAMDTDRQQGLEEAKGFVGQDFEVKVVNVNAKKNKIILSERDTVSVNMKDLLSQHHVGDVVEGIVSGVANFGVFVRFVDNPQIEGLIHISEIDHRLIDNPKEALAMNQTVKVKIIDMKDGRVFLSLKALKTNPWETAGEKFKAGQEVSGKVYTFNPFGAVIDLDGGLQGLVHISQFGGVEEMKKTLAPDTMYRFTIETIKPEEKRILLKFVK